MPLSEMHVIIFGIKFHKNERLYVRNRSVWLNICNTVGRSLRISVNVKARTLLKTRSASQHEATILNSCAHTFIVKKRKAYIYNSLAIWQLKENFSYLLYFWRLKKFTMFLIFLPPIAIKLLFNRKLYVMIYYSSNGRHDNFITWEKIKPILKLFGITKFKKIWFLPLHCQTNSNLQMERENQ